MPRDPLDIILNQPPAPREPHPAALDDDTLLEKCDWIRGRTGGPGGQNRNKVETAVTITHRATGISASAAERRTVRENKPVAIRRLRLRLATEHRAAVPSGDIRSELWRRRTPRRRIVVSTRHRDYPSMLAEALDVVEACGLDMRRASIRLETTASQLVKLIKEHPPALALLNERRAAIGQHKLT